MFTAPRLRLAAKLKCCCCRVHNTLQAVIGFSAFQGCETIIADKPLADSSWQSQSSLVSGSVLQPGVVARSSHSKRNELQGFPALHHLAQSGALGFVSGETWATEP